MTMASKEVRTDPVGECHFPEVNEVNTPLRRLRMCPQSPGPA
jgi:hypothetical protein